MSAQQQLAFLFCVLEFARQHVSIGVLEVVRGKFLFRAEIDVSIFDASAIPFQIINVFDTLNVHGEALQTIGQFNRDRVAIDTTNLLEVGKLAHLHAVAPDLPTKAPGAEVGLSQSSSTNRISCSSSLMPSR